MEEISEGCENLTWLIENFQQCMVHVKAAMEETNCSSLEKKTSDSSLHLPSSLIPLP